jgi:ketosteroid isomerase-like protein
MSTNFVDVVRTGYAAFARGDVDLLVANAAPEIEIVEPPEVPGARTYRGREGLLEGIRSWAGQWDEFQIDVERVIDAGRERVIVFTRHHGRDRQSGTPVEARWVNLHTGRNGQAIRWEVFSTLDDAFAAIGLRKLKGEN